ncbi:hypothetical protein ACNKHQ_22515 [Shigella flexneri]
MAKSARQWRRTTPAIAGQRVRHAKFGEGTIVTWKAAVRHSRLQVLFQGQGIKWLVAAYARLENV